VGGQNIKRISCWPVDGPARGSKKRASFIVDSRSDNTRNKPAQPWLLFLPFWEMTAQTPRWVSMESPSPKSGASAAISAIHSSAHRTNCIATESLLFCAASPSPYELEPKPRFRTVSHVECLHSMLWSASQTLAPFGPAPPPPLAFFFFFFQTKRSDRFDSNLESRQGRFYQRPTAILLLY